MENDKIKEKLNEIYKLQNIKSKEWKKLYKKYQKYVDELAQQYFPNEANFWARENIEAKFVSEACMRMAKYVEQELIKKSCELLKNTIDDNVLVKCGSVIKCMDVDEFVLYFCKAMEK